MKRVAESLLPPVASTASAQPAIPTGAGHSAHDTLAGYSKRERNQALDRALRSVITATDLPRFVGPVLA